MDNKNESTDINDNVFAILKPAVEKIDCHVSSVRKAQVELRETIDALAAELQRISSEQPATVDLEPYIKKLINSKRRVVLVSNIVQNVQDRLNCLQKSTEAKILKKQELVEATKALITVAQHSPQK